MNTPAVEAKPRVLFVEDEAVLREHLVDALTDEFSIEGAANGQDALKAILRHRPDIIVTDIVMPGMDGVELVRALHSSPRTASIPILMISGKAAEDLQDGFELGADAYLGKPYTEDELRVRIRGMLRNTKLRSDIVRREEQAKADLRAVQERAALLESVTDAFYALDSEWRVTYANQRALDYFRLTRAEFIGKTLWDALPPTRDSFGRQEFERAVRDNISVSFELLSPVSTKWVEIHAYPHQRGLAVNFRDITDRKDAEQRLRASEAQLRLMSDALPALISYVDADYRYRFCNARYEEWFGIPSQQAIGRTLAEVLGAAAFEKLKPMIDRALSGEKLSAEVKVPYRSGGTRDVQIDFLPDRDDTHRVRGYYALIQDISDRKATDLRLRESESRFRSMADSAPVMVWVTEVDGSCSYLSRSWYEFTGQAPEVALGFGWLNAVHSDDAPMAEQIFRDALAGHKAFRIEYRLRRADGSYAWALDAAQPRLGPAGEFLGYIGSVIDIQERREWEEKLRSWNQVLERQVVDMKAEQKLFADVVEGTDAFVQIVDREFRWLAINRASADEFERIYGVRPKVGDSMLEVLADKPDHQEAVRAIWSRALAGEEFTEISEFGDPAVRRRFYEMKYNSLRDKEGRLIGAYQFVYDVTQRIVDQAQLAEARDALRQSQKMETLGQLTGGVAHDFNNLLTPIVGALDILSRQYSSDLRARRLTDAALQAADRAKILIQRLLAFSRRQHLQTQPVDIGALLGGIRDLLTRTLGPHIQFSLQVEAAMRSANVDPNQLELALLNLAVNARDAMSHGGTLVVAAYQETITDSRRLAPGRYVRIDVQDSGAGMDEATLSRAIEPFFTTKEVGQGTGLGLSMVHGLSAQLGGDFMLESSPGRGTKASLWLPTTKHDAPSLPAEAPAADAKIDAVETILLVDDEALVRMGTSTMLADAGYNVIEAATPGEAIATFHDGLKIDLLITDFAMPEMNGVELAEVLRAQHPALPVLMITGFASLTEVQAGGLPRLAKPFRQTELIACVAEVLSAKASA
ncbi:PAS domain-containing protein [Steroidobacter sp.]|uniref:PAS domain-containing protein n=1 Tax=Steroidobacter sp. TaxID=1978227 RepID=UPI001A44FC4E|nr:PAS domain-containing protein [Steroidobacter sp.]MBL8272077.1 PAS domain-containing protein [Steroidobacter sp.]